MDRIETPVRWLQRRPADPDAAALIAELDAELHGRYPDARVYGLHPGEAESFHGVFLVGEVGGAAVLCGGVRRLCATEGELKRMYVRPAHRGRGYSRLLLAELERRAKELGIRRLLLETGGRQPEAMALYERGGYTPIPCFGEYASDPDSLCFAKELG